MDVAIGTAEGRTPTPPRRPPTPQDSEPPKALYVSSIRKDDSVATEEGEDDSLIAILAAVREQTKISKRVNFAPIPKRARPSEVSPSRRVAVDVALHSAAPSRGSAKPKRAKKVEVRRKGNAGANGRARRPQDARAQNGA